MFNKLPIQSKLLDIKRKFISCLFILRILSLFFICLSLFYCKKNNSLESQFYFSNKNEILSLHGNWKITTNPDYNPIINEPQNDFLIGYVPRMWFNSGIKDKYLVSYNTEINFSNEILNNKFGVLVFNAINSNETYINGKLIGKKGIVSKDKFNIQNNAIPSLYPIPEGFLHKGKNQITIRLADNAASGGFLEAPRICEITVCEKSFNRFLLITGGTGFFMLFIGFYHLFLFLGNRKDNAFLYFGSGTIFHALVFFWL